MLEAQRDGDGKDDEVEHGGADGLAHEDAHEGGRVPIAEAPAVGVRDSEVPVGADGVAGDPAQQGEGGAPRGRDDDHAFAKDAGPRPRLEDAEVLEEQRQLDKGGRERVHGVADEEDLIIEVV